jgi:hypothetical protein
MLFSIHQFDASLWLSIWTCVVQKLPHTEAVSLIDQMMSNPSVLDPACVEMLLSKCIALFGIPEKLGIVHFCRSAFCGGDGTDCRTVCQVCAGV